MWTCVLAAGDRRAVPASVLGRAGARCRDSRPPAIGSAGCLPCGRSGVASGGQSERASQQRGVCDQWRVALLCLSGRAPARGDAASRAGAETVGAGHCADGATYSSLLSCCELKV